MTWLARVFASAVVRRLAYALVAALLVWMGVGRAEATTYNYGSEAEAFAGCQAAKGSAQAYSGYDGTFVFDYFVSDCERHLGSTDGYFACSFKEKLAPGKSGSINIRGCQAFGMATDFYYFPRDGSECGVGEWRNPLNPTECLNSQKCLARNAEAGYKNVGATTRSAGSQCVAGCEFTVSHGSGPTVSTSVVGQAGSLAISGVWDYSGNACSANLPPMDEADAQTKKEQECIPVGSQTMCQKANGDLCYTAGTTGRQICWGPGETGAKTDGPTEQQRQPGQTEPPDTKQLPNGETGTKTGDTITTISTVTTTIGGSTTITTTTVNYNGGSGADAGDHNDGENGDGSGGDNGDDGEKNSAAGGITCSAPPVTTGDPLLAKNVEQNWVALCRGETETKNMGDDANSLAAAADALEPQELGIVQDTTSDGLSFDGNLLTLGSGACPPPPNVSINGQAFQWPAGFCDIVAALRLLFLAVATLMALRVVAS